MTGRTDRVVERRRAVALARHYREFEGLSIRQITDMRPLGRGPLQPPLSTLADLKELPLLD